MALLATGVAMAVVQATVVGATPAPLEDMVATDQCTPHMDPRPCMEGPLHEGGVLGMVLLAHLMVVVVGRHMDMAPHGEGVGVVVTMDDIR